MVKPHVNPSIRHGWKPSDKPLMLIESAPGVMHAMNQDGGAAWMRWRRRHSSRSRHKEL